MTETSLKTEGNFMPWQ